jgi:hypothetical protein
MDGIYSVEKRNTHRQLLICESTGKVTWAQLYQQRNQPPRRVDAPSILCKVDRVHQVNFISFTFL